MNEVKEWTWYQQGISYNNRLEPNYYDMVDCNWDFFFGKQWRNAALDDDKPQPVFNNINRFATFFVASIMASKIKLQFTSPVTLEESDNTDDVMNESWLEFTERIKMDWQAKNALYDGAVTGDFVGHLFMSDVKPYNGAFSDIEGQVEFELVDPNNFYVGNPNSKDIQTQPFVQVAGRDMVRNLQEEAKEQQEIQSDNDTEQQASEYGQIELEDIQSDDGKDNGKATYVITYTKKKVKDEEGNEVERVHASKCVNNAYIYENIDLGISLYPVALGNWELQRNTYHGMSFVTAAIPTQIYINRGFAAAMMNTLITSMPKLIYNKQKVASWSGMIGGSIGVNLVPGESINNVAAYTAPGNMSPQVMQMIDMAQQYMKETTGANDALLGNVNPEQASGVSITASSKQAGIPLENPKMNLYNWMEDIGRIYYDMVSNLYGTRPVVVKQGEETTIEEFDFNSLQGMFKMPKVDVGPSTYWSELATIQTLDNLLERQLIEFIDYLERMPDGYIKDKDGLIEKVKGKVKGEEESAQFVQTLPENLQIALQNMEPEQQAAMIAELQAMSPEEIQAAAQQMEVA